MRSRAVSSLSGELELLDSRTFAADRTRLAVADDAAYDRIPLVGGDDLQLARLAAEHLRRSDLTEQLAGHEMPRASQPGFLAARVEVRDQQHAASTGRPAAGAAGEVDVDAVDHLAAHRQSGVLPKRLQEVGSLPGTLGGHGVGGDELARQLEESLRKHGALPLSRTLPQVNRMP